MNFFSRAKNVFLLAAMTDELFIGTRPERHASDK